MGSTHDFRIVPAGDSAIMVEFEERIDTAVNARVIRLADAIQVAVIPGVRDVVPTYRSVTVFFEPIRTDFKQLVDCLQREAKRPGSASVEERSPISVPVCYGSDLGPDLAEVAAFAGMSADEVVAVHAVATYRVFMLGFVPGFAYLGVVDPRIAMPRRKTPRVRVPPGAVGIAGTQTGIYPTETPGGWRLIGRTPVKPFDAGRPAPFLFRAGDAVRFVPIGRAEFERLVQETLP
jgi:inhibitor of KinA